MTALPDTSSGRYCLESTEEACRYGLRVLHLHRCIKHSLTYEIPGCINDTQIIGECSLGAFSYTAGRESQIHHTDIGRYCSIGPGVLIGTAAHPTDWLSTHPFQYDGTRLLDAYPAYQDIIPTRPSAFANQGRQAIGNDVWIGDGAMILNDVTIGDGAVIAGRSVVTSNVAPYTIVAGVPARPVRDRFAAPLVERLLRLRWWAYDISPLRDRIPFDRPEEAADRLEDAMESGAILPLNPAMARLEHDHGKWFIQALERDATNSRAPAR